MPSKLLCLATWCVQIAMRLYKISNESAKFLAARDFLLRHRSDYDKACAGFRWPELETFNWALDWFDVYAKNNLKTALWLISADGSESKHSFAELSKRSSRVASFLCHHGIGRGDRILVMLPNVVPLWDLILGVMKLGAVLIPTAMQASTADLADRIHRGNVRLVVTVPTAIERFERIAGNFKRCLVGGSSQDWLRYEDVLSASASFVPDAPTHRDDPFLLYFTSGTTALPKLVLHTQYSYPVGHLSTLYWIGIQEGDIHQNISSPGWAKHAWSSCFAPWNAGATVVMHDTPSFRADATLKLLDQCGVNSLCAPPTVWRLLIIGDLGQRPRGLRELVSAGEPLNPEVIERVAKAWNLTIRDGYGQTESTAQIGNSPGQALKLGSMGRPLPGYRVALLNGVGTEGSEGEIALRLDPRPGGLMVGYQDALGQTLVATADGYYRTGDEATVDADGYYHFVGRADDVFKSSDYRISPFELESALLEHELVAEAAVVPGLDPVRLAVPKAFVSVKPGTVVDETTARRILLETNAHLAPYKRLRRIEFAELPKTISGKIRRVALRTLEQQRHQDGVRGSEEFWLEDL